MRLIDADKAISDYAHYGINHSYDACDLEDILTECPTVEAIPKAEVKKFLEEDTKDVSNKVLAIVREDYIHKADYENRLKADMVAMLEELNLEIDEMFARRIDYTVDKIQDLIQEKINSLKEA